MPVRTIQLKAGKEAIVDERFYPAIMAMGKWYLTAKGYVACHNSGTNQHPRKLSLHRVVWRLAGNVLPPQLDHENRNKLDNRLENLRPANNTQQTANQPARGDNRTGYRGVSKHKCGKYVAWIKPNKETPNIYLGIFDTPEEAAIVYDAFAVVMFGEFAYQNFPVDDRYDPGWFDDIEAA
jgi:hypothetical protein